MCDHPSRSTCDICRTINLAKNVKHPKPDMQMYDKCNPVKVPYCATELPLTPTCIKVCTKEEYKMRHTRPIVQRMPYYAHGKLMYGVKAGILVGAVYFTYTQGVWGDQRDATECLKRWQEYLRSINTRRPPTFNKCGKVVIKEPVESVIAPIYDIYKGCVTTCFAGVVKIPLLIKCAYIDYQKALQKKHEDEAAERAKRR